LRYADVPASGVNAVTAGLSVRFREVLTLAAVTLLAMAWLPVSTRSGRSVLRSVAHEADIELGHANRRAKDRPASAGMSSLAHVTAYG
jgi:hypothetical protein